jgi:hypothetical protein
MNQLYLLVEAAPNQAALLALGSELQLGPQLLLKVHLNQATAPNFSFYSVNQIFLEPQCARASSTPHDEEKLSDEIANREY